ncbi:MAG TPA: glycosyltransferase family 1 protein [Hypericibacter adhaerens]|uniref:Glycosyl transferase n=1 Tax=Hypericibacter adhaerens TaxID=2602016 RepID=A0A5J6MU03_9PROT|nr:glycosyltransferase family 1 protein [Hypericibacter adhaerens]QEX20829.1 glycosyl transferase [Hypericibacter adhaerens]HWA43578.1 glycosyltransferase family 1 protein [Hypericibacter adhaerens]
MAATGLPVYDAAVPHPESVILRILIVTDLWHPTVNGTVQMIDQVSRHLVPLGHKVRVIGPKHFKMVPFPGDPEVRVAVQPEKTIGPLMANARPNAIHIATAGPVGVAARNLLGAKRIPFTTAFWTRSPEYLKARFGVPLETTYATLRAFHSVSRCVMVPSEGIIAELKALKVGRNLKLWQVGTDTALFRPRDKGFLDLPRPIHLNVGRVTIEKNLEAFLKLDLPGSKLVVGDGPERARLQKQFPDAHFVGTKQGEELAQHYAASDVFVFPSRTDTLGLVMMEAMASGLPVAAYPVTGPNEVIGDSGAGVLDEDLGKAIAAARKIDPAHCRDYAMRFSWERSAQEFLSLLAPIKSGAGKGSPASGKPELSA